MKYSENTRIPTIEKTKLWKNSPQRKRYLRSLRKAQSSILEKPAISRRHSDRPQKPGLKYAPLRLLAAPNIVGIIVYFVLHVRKYIRAHITSSAGIRAGIKRKLPVGGVRNQVLLRRPLNSWHSLHVCVAEWFFVIFFRIRMKKWEVFRAFVRIAEDARLLKWRR